jgi:CrcB protein
VALVSALAVGVGGACGALARYAVARAIERRAVDTAAVNVAGSFLFGVVFGLDVGGQLTLAVGVGFCGAFTTFSSFAVETVRLAEDGRIGVATASAVGTLAAALAAASTGIAVAGAVSP